ncbi:hypothetical protein OG439_15960 [Amycolatopsis sp. NBC_01307]|uniref:hypothetical protein n=1 Tax=Amycolatopsis sp. NBC_01307 TaxID=2903561 RepID=UPI002E153B6F|nr:hypothetical protein OG439_15960 [Amycolatopsis sp. NBC_01307]
MDQPERDLARFQSPSRREAAADARDNESDERDRRDEVARVRDRADELRTKVAEQIRRRVELVARSREMLDRLLRRLDRIEAVLDAPTTRAHRKRAEVESTETGKPSLGPADGDEEVPAARVRVPSPRRARPAAGPSGSRSPRAESKLLKGHSSAPSVS